MRVSSSCKVFAVFPISSSILVEVSATLAPEKIFTVHLTKKLYS